ncbi:deoxyribodipyrimidine photo-lyase [Rossellomorea sp. AcN35-11]|nr:DNA photolyase family protein [Rossellomorea aquimaris]NMH69620.1 deoxyribodipyrimidine photo-lyase [Bacillus sp. RO3]WJV29331.1 deoxyribodipyrimidine photo-lyase [Rossellomorea sp. AcN35-11]
MTKRIIVLIREDLRIHDHPALYKASQEGSVIPLYILDEQTSQFPIGEAKKWWLHQNLSSFQASLHSVNGRLWLDKGKVEEVLPQWVSNTKAQAVYWNRVYDPDVYERDLSLARDLSLKGTEVQTFEGTLLLPPWKIKKEDDTPYKVYSAFYHSIKKEAIPKPVPSVKTMKVPDIGNGLSLKDLDLIPPTPWYTIMESIWDPGEEAAIKRFNTFLKKSIEDYSAGRDFPAEGHHSTLSPYLALGVISVRSLYHTLKEREDTIEVEPFIKQLIWRDFSYAVLLHFPQSSSKPLNEKFENFSWHHDEDHWERWIKGKTGYPIVDAGMRELWETGFMHNRVRMIVASFLTKHLLIPWQKGAKWFLDTLIDADLANNSMGWQWVAGSGLDSSPYFRIFNPTLQSEKFDREGSYIRMWIPELRSLPSKYIHKPSEAPTQVLDEAGIRMGESYPYPIVDHASARKRALERYNDIK